MGLRVGWCALVASIAIITALGCQNAGLKACPSGYLCPTGTVCLPGEGNTCVTPEQIEECTGSQAGDPCATSTIDDGRCSSGACFEIACGNLRVDEGEVCDDGNNADGDGCAADCRSDETCGNGAVDPAAGESCDDGNTADGDGCRANCIAISCGDGVVDYEAFEQCDNGSENSTAPNAACRPNCQASRCGDSVLDDLAGEVCDDANFLAGDGCTPDCLSTEVCGNGYVDLLVGEQCDDSNRISRDGCSSQCLPELPTWTQLPLNPGERRSPSMAFDSRRGQVMMFSGLPAGSTTPYTDLWAWDGGTWWPRTTAGSPPAAVDRKMVYDYANDRLIVVDGDSSGSATSYLSTWAYTGKWERLVVSEAPPMRGEFALGYDSARRRVVLFGGRLSSTRYNEIWEFDGTTWELVTPSNSPPLGRSDSLASYDSKRGLMLFFAGHAGSAGGGNVNELWSWNGDAWDKLEPTTSTPPPAGPKYVGGYDGARDRLVVWRTAGTYEWDGSEWHDVTPDPVGPSSRVNAAAVYDVFRQRLVLFGGNISVVGSPVTDEVWEWDGQSWQDRTDVDEPPTARSNAAHVYDALRGRLVVFGGTDDTGQLADTWEWDGSEWFDVTPESGSPTAAAPATFDPVSGTTIMYKTPDTWSWNGSEWSVLPAIGESPSGAFDIYFDTTLQQPLLLTSYEGDLWTWDGGEWTRVTPMGGGLGLLLFLSSVYDQVRGRIILTSPPNLREWDGSMWSTILYSTSVVAPTTRQRPNTWFEPNVHQSMIFSGQTTLFGNYLTDSWMWNGTSWTEIPLLGKGPAGRSLAVTAYLATRQVSAVFGGGQFFFSALYYLGDLWTLTLGEIEAVRENCRQGGDIDGDGLAGCDDPDCWAYCTPLCPPETTCPSSAPQCGDGVCNAFLETCYVCPQDCGECPALCGDFHCQSTETELSCPGDCAPVP